VQGFQGFGGESSSCAGQEPGGKKPRGRRSGIEQLEGASTSCRTWTARHSKSAWETHISQEAARCGERGREQTPRGACQREARGSRRRQRRPSEEKKKTRAHGLHVAKGLKGPAPPQGSSDQGGDDP